MDLLRIIDEIDQLLEESTKILWTNNVVVDKQELTQLLKNIKESIPEDVKKAKYVSQERNKILEEAENEARLILKEADEKTKVLLSEHEIYKAAKQQADGILEDAKQKYDEKIKQAEEFDRQMRENTWNYVTDMLVETKKYMNKSSENLISIISQLDENVNEMKNKKATKSR